MVAHSSSVLRVRARAVGSLFPAAKVETFGSFITGLSLPTSDLDIVVIGVDSQREGVLFAWSLVAAAFTLSAFNSAVVALGGSAPTRGLWRQARGRLGFGIGIRVVGGARAAD
jgi:predicted nucleotidyltransferase